MDSCCVGLGGVISLEMANLLISKGDPDTRAIWGQGYVKQLRENLVTRGVLQTRLSFHDRGDEERFASFLTHFTIIEGVDHSPIVGWGLIQAFVTMSAGADHFLFPDSVKVTKLTRSAASLMEREWGSRLHRRSAGTIQLVNTVSRIMGDYADTEAIFDCSPAASSKQ